MRIDKYLWYVRIFKTRTIATKACEHSKIIVNNSKAKASREIKLGDTIVVKKNYIEYQYKVLDFPKSRVGAKLVTLHILDQTSPAELEKLRALHSTFSPLRDAGSGRPTKKDRRDLDGFLTEDEIIDFDQED